MTNPLAGFTLVGPETAFTPAVGDQFLDGVATLTGGARVALLEDYGTGQYELSINGGAPIVAGAMNDTALPGGGFSLEANAFAPGSRASIATLGNGEFIVTWVDGTVTTQTRLEAVRLHRGRPSSVSFTMRPAIRSAASSSSAATSSHCPARSRSLRLRPCTRRCR
jgi:hypothetical protein